jgi:hypothetical protein
LNIPFPLLSSLLDYKTAVKEYFYYYGQWEYIRFSKYLW